MKFIALIYLLSLPMFAADLEVPRRNWTKEEDSQLRALHKEYGNNWKIYNGKINERVSKQCRDRWINYLAPGIKKGRLTTEEMSIIKEKHKELDNRWSLITEFLPGRTGNQVKNAWHARMRKLEKARYAEDNLEFERPSKRRKKAYVSDGDYENIDLLDICKEKPEKLTMLALWCSHIDHKDCLEWCSCLEAESILDDFKNFHA